MTAQDLMSLAERCEAATGADRELDCRIEMALPDGRLEPHLSDADVAWLCETYEYRDHEDCLQEEQRADQAHVRRFTASLDAAMTLAGSEAVSVLLTAIDTCQEDAVSDWVKALPRHICAAALRARASSDAGGRG